MMSWMNRAASIVKLPIIVDAMHGIQLDPGFCISLGTYPGLRVQWNKRQSFITSKYIRSICRHP